MPPPPPPSGPPPTEAAILAYRELALCLPPHADGEALLRLLGTRSMVKVQSVVSAPARLLPPLRTCLAALQGRGCATARPATVPRVLELAASKVAYLHCAFGHVGTHAQSFVDLDFPPTAASLGGLGAGARRYAWRRPAAFAGERGPSVFGRSISSGDVDQGERLCVKTKVAQP